MLPEKINMNFPRMIDELSYRATETFEECMNPKTKTKIPNA